MSHRDEGRSAANEPLDLAEQLMGGTVDEIEAARSDAANSLGREGATGRAARPAVPGSPAAFWRRLRPFHFGTVSRGGPRPLGLWISSGTDLGRIGVDTPRQFLNVTLFGRFRGRIYAKEIR